MGGGEASGILEDYEGGGAADGAAAFDAFAEEVVEVLADDGLEGGSGSGVELLCGVEDEVTGFDFDLAEAGVEGLDGGESGGVAGADAGDHFLDDACGAFEEASEDGEVSASHLVVDDFVAFCEFLCGFGESVEILAEGFEVFAFDGCDEDSGEEVFELAHDFLAFAASGAET